MSNTNQNNANRTLPQQQIREQIDAADALMNSFPGRHSSDCHSLHRLLQEIV